MHSVLVHATERDFQYTGYTTYTMKENCRFRLHSDWDFTKQHIGKQGCRKHSTYEQKSKENRYIYIYTLFLTLV